MDVLGRPLFYPPESVKVITHINPPIALFACYRNPIRKKGLASFCSREDNILWALSVIGGNF